MTALVLVFFTPVAALAAVVVTRPALDPLIRSIALGAVCLCLTAAALHTLG